MIRPATIADTAEIQAIYAHHVTHGTGTFEEEAPDLEAMRRRIEDVLDRGLPYLVDQEDGRLVGFAYASPFRLRSAYRYCAEDSVYVAPGRLGQGVGRRLLEALVRSCEALGLRQLIAVIGDSTNAGSVGVHRACGFEMIGAAKGVGFKHDRFLDIVFMQKPLKGGTEGAPDWSGLAL
jgi:L-amino acid N-acyltransferase YncA